MSDRMLRVNAILREVLAEEMERLNDTRLEMVTITGVDTAPNLRTATVYFDVLDTEAHESALAALRRASRRLQSAIGREVRMKYTPSLEFVIDPGVVSGERIEAILRELSQSGEGDDE
ncbi:MAG: 30S ribosome-binding factor RbfA [Actinobacteria bacterium]|nr:30S ribosome-binding factor RbfA [Actinomycetota bacterium]